MREKLSKTSKNQLQNYCSLYWDWKNEYQQINGYSRSNGIHRLTFTTQYGNPTYSAAMARKELHDQMVMIETCAKEASPERWVLIIEGNAPEELMERFYWILWNRLKSQRRLSALPC